MKPQRLCATLGVALLALAPVARAVDCWPAPIHQHSAVQGKAALAETVLRAGELLRNDPLLNKLPGLRLQLKSFIGFPATDQALPVGEIGAHGSRPPVWGPGCTLQQAKADYVSPFNVSVHFNTLDPVWHTLPSPDAVRTTGWFVPAEFTRNARGDRLHARRVLVLARENRPALVPLTVDEYLAHYENDRQRMASELRQMLAAMPNGPREGLQRVERELAELRAQRKALTPAQRSAPAAIGPQNDGAAEWATAPADAPGAITLMRPNPALFAGARAGEVRVITVSVWMNNEGDEHQAALEAWLAQLDPRPFEALLTR